MSHYASEPHGNKTKVWTAGELLTAGFGEKVWARHDGMAKQRHGEIGANLRQVFQQVTDIRLEVSNAFPTSDKHAKKALRGLAKALDGLSESRCWLEELYAKQHPDTWTTKTYYGHEQD